MCHMSPVMFHMSFFIYLFLLSFLQCGQVGRGSVINVAILSSSESNNGYLALIKQILFELSAQFYIT